MAVYATRAEGRFGWISGLQTATLNAVIESAGVSIQSDLAFSEVHAAYCRSVAERCSRLSAFPAINATQDEVLYLFQFESEMWGPDFRYYLSFFKPSTTPRDLAPILQTFLFVHSFFLIERWLHLFVPPTNERPLNKLGRAGKRRLLFATRTFKGVFTCSYKDCFASIGAPFYLLGTPTSVESIDGDMSRWEALRRRPTPPGLRSFYVASCGKEHFSEIVETTFINTRKRLPKMLLPRDKAKRRRRDLTTAMRSTWYDVLWRYSESVRYRPIFPGGDNRERPFHWNRSIRWNTSLLVSGLMSLAVRSPSGGLIKECWEQSLELNPILRALFGSDRIL